jgi:DNA repair exonuclease SbcCD nuclease subunit
MNRFIFCADLHIRKNKPQFRSEDNFLDDIIIPKLTWIITQANTADAYVAIAGDTFDNIKISWEVFNKIVVVLKKCKHQIFTIAGQHDQSYHQKNLENSPLKALELSGVVKMVDEKGFNNLYGCSWGDDIEIQKDDYTDNKVLLIHKTITPEAPPFFLKDAESADHALKKFPKFKYIIAGDYHIPHVTERNGRWVINCGSMVRQNKDQMDHTPRIYFVDIEKEIVEALMMPISPSKYAFDLRAMELSKKSDFSEEIDQLMESFSLNETEKIKFNTTLNLVVKETKPNNNVRSILSNVMETISC